MSEQTIPPHAPTDDGAPYNHLGVSVGRPLSLIHNDENGLFGVFSDDCQEANICQNQGSGIRDNWQSLSVTLLPGFETSPCVRYRGHFYLLGGSAFDPSGLQQDFLIYADNNQWQKIAEPTGWTEPRIGHAIALFNNSIWVAGGYGASGQIYDDVYSFQSGEWKTEPSLPATLCNASLAAVGKDLYLFGGYTAMPGGKSMTDLFCLVGDCWAKKENTHAPLPGPLDYWTLGTVSGESLLLLASFAGRAYTGELTPDDPDWQKRGDGLAEVVIQDGLPPFGFTTLGYGGHLFLIMTDTKGESAFAYYTPPQFNDNGVS